MRPPYLSSCRKGCTLDLFAKLSFVAGLAVLSAPAYAYIDPGSGSFLLQALIGAIAAGAVALRSHWRRGIAAIKSFLAGRKR